MHCLEVKLYDKMKRKTLSVSTEKFLSIYNLERKKTQHLDKDRAFGIECRIRVYEERDA